MEIDKESMLKGMNEEDINSVITKFVEINGAKIQFEKIAEELEIKIKKFMKEKRWNNYKPNDNISVSINRMDQQTIDKDKLKMLLSREQLESISNFKAVIKLIVIDKKQREKLKRFVNDGKKL